MEKIKNFKQIADLIKQECTNLGYSKKTIITYIYCARRFLKFKNFRLNRKYFDEYMTHLSNVKKVSAISRNQAISAIKFMFEGALRRPLDYIPRMSKVPKKLPEVLSREKIINMIETVKCSNRQYTLKHQLYIELLYSSGLRVSELISLQLEHINLEKGYICVRAGKGGKDRTVITSDKTLCKIREYLNERKRKNNKYLFDMKGGGHITSKSIELVLKKQARLCGIKERVYPHKLRSSFATHLANNNEEPSKIQALMGHSSFETTSRYIAVEEARLLRIKSPLDMPEAKT